MKQGVLRILLFLSFGFLYAAPPSANITISSSAAVCQNSPGPTITFTGSGGVAPYTFVYTVNGGAEVSVTSNATGTHTINAPTSSSGTFIYRVIRVSGTTVNESVSYSVVPANFSVNAATSAAIVCKGQTINLSSTVQNTGGLPVTYSWTGPNGYVSNIQNPVINNATSAMNGDYTVTAKIGSCERTSVVQVRVVAVEITDPYLLNGCIEVAGETSKDVSPTFSLTNPSFIQSISLNWGDGTTVQTFTSANWSGVLNHNYQIGYYTVVITATTTLGCTITQTYTSFVGSSPQAATLSLHANQANGCIPHSTSFDLNIPTANNDGTHYRICFGDEYNTQIPCIEYIHGDPIPSNWVFSGTTATQTVYTITHVYNSTSCNNSVNLNGQIINHGFVPSTITTNPCTDPQPQAGSVIRVGKKPIANFEIPQNGCINSDIVLNNTSEFGSSISGIPATCNVNPPLYWTISPATLGLWTATGLGSNNNAGNAYLNWTSGSINPSIRFLQEGFYTITLHMANSCGADQISKTICITSPITPSFTLNTQTACASATTTISATNTTNTAQLCGTTTYNWAVSHSTGFCGTQTLTFPEQTTTNASWNFSQPGTYTIRLTATTGCGSRTSEETVIVTQPPTVSINPITDSCTPGSINPVAVVNACGPTSSALTYEWTFNGGTPAVSNLQNPGTIQYSSPGMYTVSLKVTNSCGSSSVVNQTFEVKPTPTITNSDRQFSICSGVSTSPLTITSDFPATTYTWTATSSPGLSGITQTSGTSSIIPSQTFQYSGSATATVTYTVTPTLNGCTGTPVQFIYTVSPAPAFTSQPVSQNICIGGTLSALSVAVSGNMNPTYQWYSNTAATTTGGILISGATSSTYTPPNNQVGTVFYYAIITLTSGGCSELTSEIAQITVAPLPQITSQSSLTQQLCVGGSLTNPFEIQASGGTGNLNYAWYSNSTNSNSGGTLISGATSNTYLPNTFSNSGNFYFYAIVSSSVSGCTSVSSNPFHVEVVPDPVIDQQPLAVQQLCPNGSPQPLVVNVSGGIGNYSYQWYASGSNSNSGGTVIGGANASSFTPPTSQVGTIYYYVEVTQQASGCSVKSVPAQIIVNPAPQITQQPSDQEVCLNGSSQPLSFLVQNGVGNATYQWFSNTVNSVTGGVPINGADSATYLPPTSTIGTHYYFAQISYSGITGPCAIVTTDIAAISVVPSAEIITHPVSNHEVCIGGSIPVLTVTYQHGTGTPTYQWYQNTTASTSGGIAVGTNSSTYEPSVFNTAGDYYFYVVIDFSQGGCGSVTSNLAHVQVINDPVIDVQPLQSQVLCQGATPQELTVSISGGSGSPVYQWYENSTASTSGGVAIAGANQPSFTPDVNQVGTYYFYCVISQSTSGCEVKSAVAEISVNLSPSVVNQPQDQEICVDGSAQMLNFTTQNGSGNATYQWFSNATDSVQGGTLIPGATQNTFTPSTNTVGTTYYYAEITFSDIVGPCATIKTEAAEILVKELPTVSLAPASDPVICVGGTLQNPLEVTHQGGSGSVSYQWYSNTSNSYDNAIAIGSNSNTFTPAVFNSPNSYYYFAELTFGGSGCGNVRSNIIEIQVIPDPVVTVHPLSTQVVCQGDVPQNLHVEVNGGISANYLYQWYENTTANTHNGSLISGATQPDYIPNTTTSGVYYYYCQITQLEGGDCSVISNIAEVHVAQSPSVITQPQSVVVCKDEPILPLSFQFDNGVGIPVYQWYLSPNNTTSSGIPVPGANQATFTPSTNSVGSFYYYAIIQFPDLLGNCNTISTQIAELSILQDPVISNKTETICSGVSLQTDFTSSSADIIPSGTLYTWPDPQILPSGAITGANSGVQLAQLNQNLINTTTIPATVIYTITPNSGVCIGESFVYTVTVNPAIDPNVVFTDNTCYEVNSASITTNVTGGIPFSAADPYQFNWTGPNGFTSSSNSIHNLAEGNYELTITDAGGCPFTATYVVTRPPMLVFDQVVSTNVSCHNAANGAINVQVSGGTGPYSYVWTKDGVFFSSDQNINQLAPGLYEVTVTDANNCQPIRQTISISQPDPLVASVTNKTDVDCFGDNTGSIQISVAGGTPYYDVSGLPYYNYAWTGPNGYTSSELSINQLFAGEYSLIVRDSNNCEFTLSLTLVENPIIQIDYTTTEISCYGANDASMNVTLSGGKAPYTFQWSNMSTLLHQTNLSAGSYTITVTDSLGCQQEKTIIIPEAPVFMIDPIVTQISCHGANNGSIQLNLVGGIAPISLVWNDGSPDGLTRNALAPGTYTATITDSKPCQIVRTFIIVEPAPLAITGITNDAIDCTVTNGGNIDLIVSGGTPPYQYQWSNGAQTEDLNNLTNGNYAVTVTDSRGCVIQSQYVINRPDPLSVSFDIQTDSNCETREVSQTYTATVTGGIPPYSLSWSSGLISGANNSVMTTNQNGLVQLSVTDSQGCLYQHSIDVQMPVLGQIGFQNTSYGYSTYGIYSVQDPITFTSSIGGTYESVIWDFGDGTFSNDLNPVHTYVRSGSYIVSLTVLYPFGCRYTEYISIVVEDGYFLVIPTAFTPNDDRLNDTYRPVSKRLKDIRLEIYDSWGSMIYSEFGEDLVGWDGKIKGVPAENGNYYCKVKAKTFYSREIEETRTFVLIK